MNPNKLGSAAPGGGVEKTGNFTAEQNPVKDFEVEKNSEKPKTGAEIFELKMSQIANRREMIEQMKMEGKLGFDDYKTKKQALDLVETKLTKLYDIYENREVNEAKREKELELRNEQFEESKDFLRRLSQDKELPRDEKMKLMERFSQRLVDCHDRVEKVKKAREMDERVYQLFGGKSGEEKAEGETKEKTEKETEGKTEDKTELKTEEKSEISVEDSAKTNESKTSVENEASEKKEKKPTRTFSWIGGAGGPMFFPGGSASTVKVNKTTENNTADGIKTEVLNAVQKEALRQAEEKFFYEKPESIWWGNGGEWL